MEITRCPLKHLEAGLGLIKALLSLGDEEDNTLSSHVGTKRGLISVEETAPTVYEDLHLRGRSVPIEGGCQDQEI